MFSEPESSFRPASLLTLLQKPVLFVTFYCVHKFVISGNRMVPLNDLDYYSFLGAKDEGSPPKTGLVKSLFEFENPSRSKNVLNDAASREFF